MAVGSVRYGMVCVILTILYHLVMQAVDSLSKDHREPEEETGSQWVHQGETSQLFQSIYDDLSQRLWMLEPAGDFLKNPRALRLNIWKECKFSIQVFCSLGDQNAPIKMLLMI